MEASENLEALVSYIAVNPSSLRNRLWTRDLKRDYAPFLMKMVKLDQAAKAAQGKRRYCSASLRKPFYFRSSVNYVS